MVESVDVDQASQGTTTTQATDAGATKEPFVFKKLTKEDIIANQHAKMVAQKHLAVQDLENLDLTKITPLNPEIISRQATINIGTIGHVAHGKSTLVRAISNTNVSDPKDPLFKLTHLHAFRLSDINKSSSETLPSSLDTPTPSSTSAQTVPPHSASLRTAQARMTMSDARSATRQCSSTATSPLLIAQDMTPSCPP